MSQNQNITSRENLDVAPTPQNTPLDTAVLANRPANLGRPQVEDIGEGEDEDEDVSGMNPASLLAQNPALLAFAQQKLGGLVGKPSGYISSLPAPVRRRIDGLKGIQAEHSKIESEFQLAILDLEKKFLGKYTPLYERRQAIITGKAEPTDQDVETGKASDSDEEEEEEDDDEEEEGAKLTEVKDNKEDANITGIPEFWLTALKNAMPIAEQITDEDEEALKALNDIRLSYTEDSKPGFKLHFFFGPNDFFEDSEMTKTYYYQEKVGYGGDFVYDTAIGHDIKWKKDKDLTKKVEVKKQRNKTTGKTRTIRKEVPAESFFNFFKPPQPPSPESLEADDVDEAELEELDARLETDYQLGEDFKEKIIPRAVDYFTGKALQYEEDYEDEDMDDFDEDDEDFDEDDEDAEVPAAGANEDCKQQ